MEEMQQEEGLNILEIIRILLQKIKLLILVVIIGAVCGACFGYWRYADVKNYGTSIEFYINPEKPKDIGNSTNNAANAVGSQIRCLRRVRKTRYGRDGKIALLAEFCRTVDVGW